MILNKLNLGNSQHEFSYTGLAKWILECIDWNGLTLTIALLYLAIHILALDVYYISYISKKRIERNIHQHHLNYLCNT